MIVEAIFLGIVQGLTEWLPISSSGHLVIVQQLLDLQVPLVFDIAFHFGTLVSALAFFWKGILKIISAFARLDFKSHEGQIILYIILGNIPVSIVGILLYDFIASTFSSLLIVGLSLLITGILLYSSKFPKRKEVLNMKNCLIIGLAQAVALVPGISRSGATISVGRLRGIDDEANFKFSFMLSIPATIGANMLELTKVVGIGSINFAAVIIGIGIAAVVGYLSLKLLYDVLKRGRFHLFAFYCWTTGIVVLALSMA